MMPRSAVTTASVPESVWLPPANELRPSLGRDDPLPPPPFAVSLTLTPSGWSAPYTVRSMATHQAAAGHIDSLACAEAIATALNEQAARAHLGIEI